MDISANGMAELLISEAIVTSRYRDSVGVMTIGVGHTKAAGGLDPSKFTGVLTVAECLDMFVDDIEKYVADVDKAVKVPVTQYEFDAMVSFHYNTGAIGRASFVKALNSGASRATVAAGFMSWTKPPEIVGRRTREMNLFRTGRYDPAPKAGVYTASNGAVQWRSRKSVDALSILAHHAPIILPKATPDDRPILRIGSKGPFVAEWQKIINVTDDGNFGPMTEATTQYWQANNGLVPDGVVGGKSWSVGLQGKT